MDPVTLLPQQTTLPVHWGWFRLLLIVTFMAHILLMNVMVGSGVIALTTSLFSRAKGAARLLMKDVSEKLTFTIALTINLGVAPLLFLQVLYGQFIYVSSILMAAFWLALVPVLIVAYYAAYIHKARLSAFDTRFPLLFLTVGLLLLTGFMFSCNMTLMVSPEAWKGYFSNPHGTFLNLSDPTLVPRYLHFMTAALAVGGLFTALVWSRKRTGGQAAQKNVRLGMAWFAHATFAQIPVGGWFFMSLPEEVRALFMGGDLLHTALFFSAMAGVVLCLLFGFKGKVKAALFSLLPLVLVMVLVRDLVRGALLSPWFRVSAYPSTGEYVPMVIFFVSLLAGVLAVVYMVKLAKEAMAGEGECEGDGKTAPCPETFCESEGLTDFESDESVRHAAGERR